MMTRLLFALSSAAALLSSTSIAQLPSSSTSSSTTVDFVSGALSSGKVALHHSFRGPFDRTISGWSHGAGAFISEKSISLTPAKPQRTGYLWNTHPVLMTDWEVTFDFSVTGSSPSSGGDGFAFWYASQPELLGTVFGSTDFWIGMGIFFDTRNDDNIGSSPSIVAVWNDGTQRYDAQADGASQAHGSCSIDFRNSPFASARIRFAEATLTVDIATKLTTAADGSQNAHFTNCLKIDNLDLGVDKYFGLTAHTGDIAPDAHELYALTTIDLSPSDADLAKARKHWSDSLDASQSKEGHQNLDSTHFQHSVLNTLAQIQEELNLVEMSQLSLSDFLYSQKPMTAGVTPGGSEPVKSLGDASGKPDPVAMSASEEKLDRLADTIQSLQRDIRTAQSSLNVIQSSTSAAVAAPAASQGRGASAGDAGERAQLARTVTATQTDVGQLKDQTAALHRKLDVLQSSINNTSSGSASSWTQTLMLIFITISSGIMSVMAVMQHKSKERYKMI